ncbi:MAG: sigma-54 dependent transcriptional regulator [Pseudomonadota bacterium]
MSRLLIIDDESVIRKALRRFFERSGFDVEVCGSIEDASALPLASFDIIISDLRLPGEPGTAILKLVDKVPVIIMTSYASVRSAVDAIREGAIDYISKPFDHEELLLLVERTLAVGRDRRQRSALEHDIARDYPSDSLIGDSDAMRTAVNHMEKVAPIDMPVLISGESGTGKELFARAIHNRSTRRHGPFVTVNCGAGGDGMIEESLFGRETGDGNGQSAAKQGLAEAANGGTLFLSAVDALPADAQARLLQLLRHGDVRPIGASYTRKVDVRILASTRFDLSNAAAENRFDTALLYTLRVVEITLPPLRDRRTDVPVLAHHFLRRSAERLNRQLDGFEPEALSALNAYHWPGNVRELGNAVERAAILSDGPHVLASQLALDAQVSTPPAADLSLDDYFRHFVETHQQQLTETELAARLGISRKALWERRQRMGIPRQRGNAV